MDGSDIRTVVAFFNNTNNYTFLFALDYSKQVLYWIKSSNSSSCNHNDFLESSRVDGSERRIVVTPRDCYYYGSQAIDLFGGIVYSYSRHSHKIFKTVTVAESTPKITNFSYINNFIGCHNSWHRYGCMCNSQTGMKIISFEHQMQGSSMHVRPVTAICFQAISRYKPMCHQQWWLCSSLSTQL